MVRCWAFVWCVVVVVFVSLQVPFFVFVSVWVLPLVTTDRVNIHNKTRSAAGINICVILVTPLIIFLLTVCVTFLFFLLVLVMVSFLFHCGGSVVVADV